MIFFIFKLRQFKHAADEDVHAAFDHQPKIYREMEKACKPIKNLIPALLFWLHFIDDSPDYYKSNVEYQENKHGLDNLEAIVKSTP